MHKKAHLTLKLSPNDALAVKIGDAVKPGDVLVTFGKPVIHEYNLAKYLEIEPAQLSKYLLVTDGSQVILNQPIARKKGLMNKHTVKVPVAGEFFVVDANAGIVGIKEKKASSEIVSWFSGTVSEINPEKIIFEVLGQAIIGTSGKGEPVSGTLLYFPDLVDVFSMPTNLQDRVLVLREAVAEVVAKADALGVSAIISQKLDQPPFKLPYVVVSDIEVLKIGHEKTSIVYGREKQILIIEEKLESVKNDTHKNAR